MSMLVILHDGFSTHSRRETKATFRNPLAVTISVEDTLRNLTLRNTAQKADLQLRPKPKGERFPLFPKNLTSYARRLGVIEAAPLPSM